MTPFAANVRYRFGEAGESRDASFHGLFFDRSDDAVLGRLKEVHRLAPWVEVVDVRWRGGGGGGTAREGGRDGRRHPVHPRARDARAHAGAAAPGDAAAWPEDGRRRHLRSRMFKPAQVAFGGAIHDCVLLNASRFGAHACLRASVAVPEVATLRLPGGACQLVRRRWQEGRRVGFEAVGTAPLVALAA